MPCGKKPLVKKWDRPKNLRVITPSRYEQNEASVKLYWKKVLRDLEFSYKDDKFWESSTSQVRELVGPVIFKRLAQIFNLPHETPSYQPPLSDSDSLAASENFYKAKQSETMQSMRPKFSMSDYDTSDEEVEEESVQEESWSESSESVVEKKFSNIKSAARLKSGTLSTSFSKSRDKSFSTKLFSRTIVKSNSGKISRFGTSSVKESAYSGDDLEVHAGDLIKTPTKTKKNPHFEMLYCNESETDMIKWKSNYKQKSFEVSASDEFSKKAEIMTKKIAKEFYEWWVGLGNVEFKSEIKRPEDIEDLFQVWFDEHASRGLMMDPKILPCVLQSIADYVGVPKAACPKVLKRQIAYDVHAETSPAHVKAFGTCLPQKMKHIPPKNDTKQLWHCVEIPEDLRTMGCVWKEISHLTSTKAFQKWLQMRPHLPMPPVLRSLGQTDDKKSAFVVPSDFVFRDRISSSSISTHDLALPISQFSLELKDVLNRLMNQ